MKIVVLVARVLLGLMFLVFGSNMFLHFLPMGQLPAGPAGQYMGALFVSHHFYVVGALMVAAGILLLANRFVPLGLIFLGPILVNILLYHTLMRQPGLAPGSFATLLWFVVFWSRRAAFAGVFQARTAD